MFPLWLNDLKCRLMDPDTGTDSSLLTLVLFLSFISLWFHICSCINSEWIMVLSCDETNVYLELSPFCHTVKHQNSHVTAFFSIFHQSCNEKKNITFPFVWYQFYWTLVNKNTKHLLGWFYHHLSHIYSAIRFLYSVFHLTSLLSDPSGIKF